MKSTTSASDTAKTGIMTRGKGAPSTIVFAKKNMVQVIPSQPSCASDWGLRPRRTMFQMCASDR